MTSPRAPSSSRRALLAGAALSLAAPAAALAAAPSASPPPPDPHPAMLPEVLRLWREHRRTMFGWGRDPASAEHSAAIESHHALVDHCAAVAELPAPRTLEGLSALGVAVGLAFEELVTEDSDIVEAGFGALVSAVLAATGAAMPDDWRGMRYQPKSERMALAGEDAR